MLPYDTRPWAKPLAGTVIVLTIIALAIGAIYLHSIHSLGIPEVVGIILLLLAILPPNINVWLRKPPNDSSSHPKADRPILH